MRDLLKNYLPKITLEFFKYKSVTNVSDLCLAMNYKTIG